MPRGADDFVIQRVQQGDRAAYLELFDRYYSRVESYARWRTRDPESARDAASETFLRAYRSIASYRVDAGSSYLAYLLQICRRIIGAEQQRSASVVLTSIDENHAAIDRAGDESDVPLLYLLEEERREMLHDALDRLSEDDREIIHLAFERDLSRRDIAEIMSKPSVTAVTSHLYRAIQKLKAAVVEQGYFVAPRKLERR